MTDLVKVVMLMLVFHGGGDVFCCELFCVVEDEFSFE